MNKSLSDLIRDPAHAVHMAGIGGVGMAGLALLLKAGGRDVTGCDAVAGSLFPWLHEQGITCATGHDPAHLEHAPSWVVRSPAVALDEPELVAARARGIPVVDRGRVLPELLHRYRAAAVAGTHGKTTTASMLAWILVSSGVRTSFCIGGVCPNLGAVARAEPEGAMVVEADESDGTLQFYAPDVAVITNMDLDHVDFFRDAQGQRDVYARFAAQARVVIVLHDDPAAGWIADAARETRSFGFAPGAGVRAERCALDAHGSSFDVLVHDRLLARITLGVSGRHNILNALAAIAAAMEWGIEPSVIAAALASFRLPRRRFEQVVDGPVKVFSDYAHHPAEIDALIQQARLLNPRRLTGVFQPHRYSRTRAFKKEFAASLSALDDLVLAPVYAASEEPLAGGTSVDLHEAFIAAGARHVRLAASLEDAWRQLESGTRDGDVVLIIGAGDVEQLGTWAARAWAARKEYT